ncbi:hypothetical protein FisN_15Hh210 [Fistulifera solaris]|uniref:Uncharacterized protein n=1 Tax=Fistulifera solaris TaxID=1519565 RepID=A0A1Z5JG46_FISSO|nr:hypothetical protein FisN_15Hh210 [Fistulifera solaris]|eukprot:GAX12731.1 hypothetical protein FisN_15Hh210 [Fistulifera solaris]
MKPTARDSPKVKNAAMQLPIHDNSEVDEIDLSALRGMPIGDDMYMMGNNSDLELENLAEIVPNIKARRRGVDVADDAGSLQPDKKATISRISEFPSREMMLPRDEKEKKGALVSMRALGGEELSEAVPDHDYASAGHAYDADYEAVHGGADAHSQEGFSDFPDSDNESDPKSPAKVPKEFVNMSSGQSISTATQTNEVRMPMYLPTFKPATGCTNASDFIVRCFIARLRSGITVVKHGRSRWCKSRLRVLHIHPDGRSLSWKPAEGEPNSAKRAPKLDLNTCLEVRHAWSPDPQNPMYTGTQVLRQKCEAANAHKSFALIFKHRTVDITAVTADQCKVLMEGFSALCFRLQLATIAARSGKKGQAMPEEDGVSTTASATLTNTSAKGR